MVAFGVCSAGFMIDFDTEVKLYTEMGFWPGQRTHVELTVLVSYRLELPLFFYFAHLDCFSSLQRLAGSDNSPPIPARPEQSFL